MVNKKLSDYFFSGVLMENRMRGIKFFVLAVSAVFLIASCGSSTSSDVSDESSDVSDESSVAAALPAKVKVL